MNRRHVMMLLWLTGLLWLGPADFAQMPVRQQAGVVPAVQAAVQPARLAVRAGAAAPLSVRVVVPAGHHAYLDAGKDGSLIPVSIDLSSLARDGFVVTPTAFPKGSWEADFQAEVLRGEVIYTYAVSAPAGANAASRNYAVAVRSQVCNDATGACNFPRTDRLTLRIEVIDSPSAPAATAHAAPGVPPAPKAGSEISEPTSRAPVTPGPAGQTASPAATVRQPNPNAAANPLLVLPRYVPRSNRPVHGPGIWLLLAFAAGLLLNVMPCVLPVMSIKVLSLVQHAGESRRRTVGMGMAFAAGMLLVFLLLASAAIAFGLGWGEQFQRPTFLIAMIAVVFAFALSLLGVYEFGVPRAVGALATQAPCEGYAGAFFMGVLATLLATPCSGPLLGSTLAWTLAQPPATIVTIFAMLGAGMALPYVLLTIHPALLTFLPRPGAWMETFKQVMGFLLLGTVVYLMMSLDPRRLLPTVAFLLIIGVGGWLWGRYSPRMDTAGSRLAMLALVLAVLVAGGWLSFTAVRGLTPTAAAEGGTTAWEPFDEARLLQFHREGRSVMLDFTAKWCANCQFNEARVYNSPEVRRLLRDRHVVAMQADLTTEGPETAAMRRLMAQLGARSIPFLAIFPGDHPEAPYTLYDLVKASAVRDILRALPDAPRR